jgi:protoporphyrinogen/coproporphyrinogen III oxidase
VIVIGAGISGLCAAHAAQEAGVDVLVLESDSVVGGKLRSSLIDGYTFDWGANGFLANVPETLALVRTLGLDDALLGAADEARRRYLYWDGGLRPIPDTLGTFLRSELVSAPGKVRALAEFAMPLGHRREESVYDFLARHFGFEVARVFSGPLVQGISAGDPRQLSLDAMFPRLRALEASHASLLRGLMAARRAARAAGGSQGEPRLTTFRDGGVGRLTDALREALGDRIRLGTRATALRSRGRSGSGAGVEVRTADGETFDAEQVVIALPAFAAADLVRDEIQGAAAALDGIRYVDVHVIACAYDRIDVPHALDGFGYLVPRGQRVRSLGALWGSAVFPDQAPPGKVLLRVLAGGALDPGFSELDDEAAVAVVRRDLEVTMGITAEPERVHVTRWRRGIPQFALGHRERVQHAREGVAATLPGVRLAGNYLDGVGVNDAVRTATAAVRSLIGAAGRTSML